MGDGTHPEFIAWYTNLQATLRSFDRISADFEAAAGMPIAFFEALGCLIADEDGRRRMSELAETLLLTRGGTTRLVARLEEAGLVTREIPPSDRRATYAVLTDAGRDAFATAKPVQVEVVERHFTDALDTEDALAMLRISHKVLSHMGEEIDWLSEAGAQAESAASA
jgi:DNA-binding MarR family transcriptional regulator